MKLSYFFSIGNSFYYIQNIFKNVIFFTGWSPSPSPSICRYSAGKSLTTKVPLPRSICLFWTLSLLLYHWPLTTSWPMVDHKANFKLLKICWALVLVKWNMSTLCTKYWKLCYGGFRCTVLLTCLVDGLLVHVLPPLVCPLMIISSCWTRKVCYFESDLLLLFGIW